MISMDEGARPAVESDIDAIAALCVRAAAEMAPLRGGSVWSRLEARKAPVRAGLLEDLGSDEAFLVVGTVDTAVVGYGAVRLVTLHDGALLGRVGDIYVMPEGRGVGVGEAMMELLLGWARQRGCIGVDSLALPGDRATKNFFETHGLVARSITVHRALTSPAETDPAAERAPAAERDPAAESDPAAERAPAAGVETSE